MRSLGNTVRSSVVQTLNCCNVATDQSGLNKTGLLSSSHHEGTWRVVALRHVPYVEHAMSVEGFWQQANLFSTVV